MEPLTQRFVEFLWFGLVGFQRDMFIKLQLLALVPIAGMDYLPV